MLDTYLTAKIFNLNSLTFQRHHQARLKLILCATEFRLRYNFVQQQTELMYQVWYYLCGGIPLMSRCVGNERSEEPEKR